MKLKELLNEMKSAEDYATEKHKGQKRMGGEPYIIHPKRVAGLIRRYKKGHKQVDAFIKAALLHDTIEDTDTTEEDLRKMFGGLVTSLVIELTSDKEKAKEVGKEEYLSGKMINMTGWALTIKLADRLDNISDLESAKPRFVERYKKETAFILDKLEHSRKLSFTQKRIAKAIRKKLKEIE